MDALWLSQRLTEVQPVSASSWTNALCPAHGGDRASFGFRTSPDGQVAAVKCFHGCSLKQIAEGLGLTVEAFRRHPVKASKKIQALYDYPDEQGTLLYQVVRLLDKQIRFRHPDSSKRNGWSWEAQGIRRVLYQLPDLVGQAQVYLTEGEKDADVVRLLDLPATTNPGGANAWSELFTDQLVAAGVRQVIVLPDNDVPGTTRAWAVARSCLGKQLQVKIIPLPELPPKGDISDWIGAGHTREDLEALVAVTPGLTVADLPTDGPTVDPNAHHLDPRLVEPFGILNGLAEYPDNHLLLAPLDAIAAVLTTITDPTLHELAVRETYMRLRVKKIKDEETRKLIKAAMSKARIATGAATGQLVTFTDPEPSAEPVDGAVLLDDLVALQGRFVVWAKEAGHAVALWTVFTWCFESFGIAPYLTLQSPLKRCGKTRVMILLKWLTRRPLLISNTSPAPIYRLVAQHQPSMLFDECDTFIDLHPELQNILNAGHNRESAYVLRCVGDDNNAQTFSVYAPKALALIGSALPGTVLDRSILIPMRRKAKSEVRERLSPRSYRKLKPMIDPLLQRLARWAKDHAEVLQNAEPALPETLNDREQDNWEPLLAIADAIGGKWPGRARHAAKVLSGAADEGDDSPGFKLLLDIQSVFKATEEKVPTTTLLSKLREISESPWGAWGKRGDPLGPEDLAKLLKPFKVRSRQVWDPSTRRPWRGYLYKDFEAVFALYLPELTSNPLGPLGTQDSADLGTVSDPLGGSGGSPLAGSKSDVIPSATKPLAGLAGSKGVNGGDPQHPHHAPVPRTPIR